MSLSFRIREAHARNIYPTKGNMSRTTLNNSMTAKFENRIQDCHHPSNPTAPPEITDTGGDNRFKCPAAGVWIELRPRDTRPVCMNTSCRYHDDIFSLSPSETAVYNT